MPRNVEIKARVSDPASLRERVEALADQGPSVIDQEDTFFHCPSGRLKLRRLSPSHGQLIFYQRRDTPGPRESRYTLAPTTDPDALRDLLAAALGVVATVHKRRVLYLIGQTRVHLDAVELLGDFVELEVVLEPEQTEEHGSAIAEHLLDELRIPDSALIDKAYVDLLMTAGGTGARGE
jgi:adenylate cyclase class IV